jgi:hypothetical protein
VDFLANVMRDSVLAVSPDAADDGSPRRAAVSFFSDRFFLVSIMT